MRQLCRLISLTVPHLWTDRVESRLQFTALKTKWFNRWQAAGKNSWGCVLTIVFRQPFCKNAKTAKKCRLWHGWKDSGQENAGIYIQIRWNRLWNWQKFIKIKRRYFHLKYFRRKGRRIKNIDRTLEALCEVQPDFISVTFGAGGSANKIKQ